MRNLLHHTKPGMHCAEGFSLSFEMTTVFYAIILLYSPSKKASPVPYAGTGLAFLKGAMY